MKKLVVSAIAVMGVMFVSLGSAFGAHAVSPAHTDVTGVVTNNGVAVMGADVKVTCNGHVLSDVTDAAGAYVVSFFAADCPFGTTAVAVAQKSGMSGMSSNTVMGITTKLNLAVVNVSVPEFGLVGALTAAGAGLGFITYTRRRQKQNQN